MALMSGHHIDFVALDLALQHDRGATGDDPLAELADHRSGVIFVDFELLGDLLPVEFQAHEIQARDPGAQRLMMAGEDGLGQVIEASAAAPTFVALPVRLGVIPAVLDDRSRGADSGALAYHHPGIHIEPYFQLLHRGLESGVSRTFDDRVPILPGELRIP